jgi:hypothetical protein
VHLVITTREWDDAQAVRTSGANNEMPETLVIQKRWRGLRYDTTGSAFLLLEQNLGHHSLVLMIQQVTMKY